MYEPMSINDWKRYFEENAIYHGSRGGIIGNITPSSRPGTDFGKGFYMGTNEMQTKALISSAEEPVQYVIKFTLKDIDEENILLLDGEDWLHTILAYRTNVETLKEHKYLEHLKNKADSADVMIGKIADDRMLPAIRAFENNALTDKGLLYCLEKIDYGFQIVAKSPKTCENIIIMNNNALSGEERDIAYAYSREKQKEGDDSIREAQEMFLRDGLFIGELLDELDKKVEMLNRFQTRRP